MAKNTGIEEKIALLLRKAESTDSEHERDALSAAAEKLMIKYGIEMAQLDLDPKHRDSDPIEMKKIVVRGIYSMQQNEMIQSVAQALGARAFAQDMRRWNGTIVVTVLDFRSTLTQTTRLCESMIAQGERAMRVWWKRMRTVIHANEGYVARRSYLAGFTSGVYNRIFNERKEALGTIQGAGELVLARESKLEDMMRGELNVGVRRKSKAELVDMLAQMDGREDGLLADTSLISGDLTS